LPPVLINTLTRLILGGLAAAFGTRFAQRRTSQRTLGILASEHWILEIILFRCVVFITLVLLFWRKWEGGYDDIRTIGHLALERADA